MPSLSQKYRPRCFADVTGQRHITETLRKEAASGILGHAYLFCGPRGVGKTTAARIFAKALNCEALKDGEPCNECRSCDAANNGRHLDLIEMDAATHTKVEEVREAIVEHVRFGPSQGKRKVYILDEAHMLSASSWNALLKTLEEPPPYAFFILATTEWHRVPTTIVSRCQRFEFRRINDADLAQRIKQLAEKEGWTIDDAATALIVRHADGCVRDAETLLGQIGALGETHLTADVVALVIPPGHRGAAIELLRLWTEHAHAEALQKTQALFDEGIPILPLFDDLIELVRLLLGATASSATATVWQQGTADDCTLAGLIGRFTPLELNDLALLLFERRRDLKAGIDPLFSLQLASTVAACGLLRHAPHDTEHGTRNTEQQIQSSVPDVLPVTLETPPVVKTETKKETPLAGSGDQTVLELNAVRVKWDALIRAVEEKNHSLPFILKISKPERISGDCLIIRFSYPFHKEKIFGDPKHLRIVEDCARLVFACPTCRLEGVVGEEPGQQETRQNDMVGTILKAFGGQVVE